LPIQRKITVATHRGRFHADEAFGVALLSLAGYKLKVLRLSRGSSAIHQADFKLDIGKRHDPANGYFDHHQNSGAGKRTYPHPHNIPYATAGLLWQHLGLEMCGGDATLFELVDKALFIHVDAVDYGMKLYGGETLPVSTIIAQHNADDETDNAEQHRRFMQAVTMCKAIIKNAVRDARKQQRCAGIIRNALAHHTAQDYTPHVLELPEQVEWRGRESKQLLLSHGVDIVLMPGYGDQTLIHVVNRDLKFPHAMRQNTGADIPSNIVFTNHRQARATSAGAARALARTFLRINNRLPDDGDWQDTPRPKTDQTA